MKKITLSIILLSAVILYSCVNEEQELYETAKVKNMIISYKEYIEAYPEGKYLNEMEDSLKARNADEAFILAKRDNMIHTYRDFLKDYSYSKYKQEAKDSVYSLEAARAFKIAELNNSIQSFQNVIDEFPKSRFAVKAKRMIDNINNLEKSGTFTDKRDGKEYKWVRIGEQVWMGENLAYDYGINSSSFEDNDENVSKFGYLYSFNIAKNVCPDGWHLPSKREYNDLLNKPAEQENERFERLIGEEENSFHLIFGGWKANMNSFYGKDGLANLWTSTEKTGEFAWGLLVNKDQRSVELEGFNNKIYAYSVRCIED